jgi:GNAT superfamily N-acetyltransferase
VLRLRSATPADADVLAATVAEGFRGYADFAPPGWRAPQPLELALGIGVRLRRARMRAWLAEQDGEPAGHVTYLPATESQVGSDDPSLAHLEQLFVRRAHWGSGAATALLRRAVEEAASEGYTAMRLGTPTAQLRARRFYEREGWTLSGEPFVAEAIGLELVEYRRELRGCQHAPRT